MQLGLLASPDRVVFTFVETHGQASEKIHIKITMSGKFPPESLAIIKLTQHPFVLIKRND